MIIASGRITRGARVVLHLIALILSLEYRERKQRNYQENGQVEYVGIIAQVKIAVVRSDRQQSLHHLSNQSIKQSIDRSMHHSVQCASLVRQYSVLPPISSLHHMAHHEFNQVLVSWIGQICFCLRFFRLENYQPFLSKNFPFLGHLLKISSSNSSSSILFYVRITFGIVVWTDYYRKCLRRRRRIPCHPTVRTVCHVVSREPAHSPPHPCISSIRQGMAYPLNGVCEWSAEPPQQVRPLGWWHCVVMLRWWLERHGRFSFSLRLQAFWRWLSHDCSVYLRFLRWIEMWKSDDVAGGSA